MQVSRSAYYQWLEAKTTDSREQQLEEKVVEAFQEHKRRYVIRRICAELKGNGTRVSRYKCRRIMQRQGLKAILSRSFYLAQPTASIRTPCPLTCSWTVMRPNGLAKYGLVTLPTFP